MELHLRPHQKDILAYRSGKMGIAAVPGSGKTWILSALAAQIIARGDLKDDQEVLVVTLVNSAVDNFYQRVSTFVERGNLVPNLGYRVRTLHGLAHDIVRERPEKAGLDNNFQIVDERESEAIIDEVAQSWLHSYPYHLEEFLNPDLDDGKRAWIMREQVPEMVRDIASAFIRYAKDHQSTPEYLKERLDSLPLPLPLAEMGFAIYSDYQRSLMYRGAVDFDDLIRLALFILQTDDLLLDRLRYRWPYVLEDEAQDSSRLQEQILSILAGSVGNWVRVGDPNQAIYETFTTADPIYLRSFIHKPFVIRQELPVSGRSTLSILNLANYLVQWTQTQHPIPDVRDALQAPPYIEPASPDDPKPNPPDRPNQVYLVNRHFTPQEEILAIADSLEKWLPDNTTRTVAVLAPRNMRAFELVDELRRRKIDYTDSLLRSSSETRFSAGVLGNILRYLSDPQSAGKLATVYRVWRRGDRDDEEALQRNNQVVESLKKCRHVEDFIWPATEIDWLEKLPLLATIPEAYGQLVEFRDLVRRWQGTVLLPVDQIVLAISQDLLSEPSELAIAHKLAMLLKQAGDIHPAWRLPELSEELAVIARNERRFLGFSEDDSGFDPERYKGKVVVSTMHKAKGLEWDRVYLMSVNNYDFPSGMSYDDYISEKWYIRNHLNLEAEALDQLEALMMGGEFEWYHEGRASQRARLDYVRERLRLLYVGITRAREELVITWNSGRQGNLQPAVPLVALQEYCETRMQSGGTGG